MYLYNNLGQSSLVSKFIFRFPYVKPFNYDVS